MTMSRNLLSKMVMAIAVMGSVVATFFQITTVVISIPSVILLTCLMISLWGGSIRFNTAMGRLDEARAELELAKAVEIADPEDRAIVETDLKTEPWFGL